MAELPRSIEDAELDALMVHDLRSPIAAITANLGFLRSTPSLAGDAACLEALQDVESAARIIQQLVDNFALLSSLESAPPTVALEPVDLHQAVHGCLDRLRPILVGSEVPIRSSVPTGPAGFRVLAAPKLVAAALDNLVAVAVRHTPKREHVEVAVREEARRGVVEIRDGSPPPPDDVARALFTRAGQCSAKRDPSSRYGRGLGLLVAGLAVRACGGSIEAIPRDGRNAYMVAFDLV